MSSLPNSFTYGSVSSIHSVRDAFASCEYPPHLLLKIAGVPCYHADYRSQYYPSSNVQTSDTVNDFSDDEPPLSEPLDPSGSIDGWSAQGHPQRTMGVPEQSSVSNPVSEALQTVSTRGHPIRARRGRETTPLLRKAASFTVFSPRPAPVSASRTDYNTVNHPDGTAPQIANTIPPATVDYKGKSTYGQTVSLLKNPIFERCLVSVSAIQLHRSPLGDRHALRAACIRICRMAVGHGPHHLFWLHHLLHVSNSPQVRNSSNPGI